MMPGPSRRSQRSGLNGSRFRRASRDPSSLAGVAAAGFARAFFFSLSPSTHAGYLERPRFDGTFAPFFRASESPIAIACLRLVTFVPDRPDMSVPLFFLRIARSTLLLAAAP